MTTNERPPTGPRRALTRREKRPGDGANSTSRSNCTPIYALGKVVGNVIGEYFIRRMKKSKHFLRQPPAIASNIDTLEQAVQAGARFCTVFETESNRTYQVPISRIYEKGRIIERGFGKQIALALHLWDQSNDKHNNEQLELWGPKKPPIGPINSLPSIPQRANGKVRR
jgi:hypothetical protein